MKIKTGKPALFVARIAFSTIMVLLWPLRVLGFFGVKSRPIYFDAGSKVPFWLELYYPYRYVRLDFIGQNKVWFDYRTGYMMCKAIEPATANLYIRPKLRGDHISGSIVVGAPTCLIGFDGERAPQPALSYAQADPL